MNLDKNAPVSLVDVFGITFTNANYNSLTDEVMTALDTATERLYMSVAAEPDKVLSNGEAKVRLASFFTELIPEIPLYQALIVLSMVSFMNGRDAERDSEE